MFPDIFLVIHPGPLNVISILAHENDEGAKAFWLGCRTIIFNIAKIAKRLLSKPDTKKNNMEYFARRLTKAGRKSTEASRSSHIVFVTGSSRAYDCALQHGHNHAGNFKSSYLS